MNIRGATITTDNKSRYPKLQFWKMVEGMMDNVCHHIFCPKVFLWNSPCFSCTWLTLWIITDAPKIQGPAAVFTWEGNPANITCEALAHPGAFVSWFRDGQLLPSTNTTNIKIYNTPAASFLEVRHHRSSPSAFRCPLINVSTLKLCLTLIIAFWAHFQYTSARCSIWY